MPLRALSLCQPEGIEDDGLAAEELIPKGGSWGGLLFDYPTIGLAPRLTWTFTVDFEDVQRSYGSTGVSLSIDWVPLAAGSWRRMVGQVASAAAFAEPVESSAYFFEHYRYDAVDLRVVDQRDQELHVRTDLSGDIDGLGIETVHLDGWLRFNGIIVQVSDVPATAAAATVRLRAFTDTDGLACSQGSSSFKFQPVAQN